MHLKCDAVFLTAVQISLEQYYGALFSLKQEICIINHNQKIQQRQDSHADGMSLQELQQVSYIRLWDLYVHSSAVSIYQEFMLQ